MKHIIAISLLAALLGGCATGSHCWTLACEFEKTRQMHRDLAAKRACGPLGGTDGCVYNPNTGRHDCR